MQEAMPDIEPQASHEVFEFCLRRRNTRRTYNTCVYHVGSAVEVHEKYSPAIRRCIEDFCYRFLHDSDQYDVIEAGVQAAITGKFEVKTLGTERVQTREILKSITQTGKSVRSSILSEADLIDKAEVVFITIGSMSRPEFVKSTARFDMVIMEEVAKDSRRISAYFIHMGTRGKGLSRDWLSASLGTRWR